MDTTIIWAPNGSLRQRMLQDMKLRGLGAHTQQDYIRHVRSFATYDPSPRFWAALPTPPTQKTSGDFNSTSIGAPLDRRPSTPQYRLCASSSP